ncbi:MAG: hypothetical protein FJX75_04770 [Armatimonadetes bacterium]|nr:hypothetical protein [Armatimonadota bacterium]
MRGRLAAVALVVLAALAAGVVWRLYGNDIRLTLALRKCSSAWDRLRDYESDFRVDVKLGPLNPSVKGTVAYLKPHSYRLQLGDPGKPDCTVVKTAQNAYVSFPGTRLPLLEVEFAPEAEADSVVAGQLPRPWVEQLGQGSEFQWIGRDEVNGRACTVLELVPPSETTADGGLIVAPALGKQFTGIPLVGSWQRTRVYLDRKTGLPIRGEALKSNGALLFSWTASNVRIDQGLSASDFGLPSAGQRTVNRTYDPAHPERLFLPPERGRSLLRRLGDALEEGAKEYLEGEVGDRDGSGRSLGEHAIDQLTD